MVRRVEDYLLRQERFRYTTEVGTPANLPLLDFLFHTHAGYFPGVGWVPFNLTPGSALADVAAGLDVLQAGTAPSTGAGGTLFLLGGAAAALVLLVLAGSRLGRRRGPRTPLTELLVRLAPQPSRPRTTLRGLHPTLTEIGPATAELALVAERARFAAADSAQVPRPALLVLRALVADVGLGRALALMLRIARS